MSLATAIETKRRRPFSWLGNPIGYTICGPLATIAGAGTTIAAPILLDPVSFLNFALLMSIFQYVGDFDIGLSRLMDRVFSGQSTSPLDLQLFLIARLVVAACVSAFMLFAWLNGRTLIAAVGMAGVAVMLSFGPVAFYRASSNIYGFTVTALFMQAGLSIPRLAGLWVGGVRGCIFAMTIWYVMTAIVINAPFFRGRRKRRAVRVRPVLDILKASFPLCVFGSLWLAYLVSSRWFSWLFSSQVDAGLFAFGANMLSVGIGLIAVIAPAYYPRHLKTENTALLGRELYRLLIGLAVGVLGGEVWCHFGLSLLFPKFSTASTTTAVILISGIPLGLCMWLVPLVIARSSRPWREGALMFGTSLMCQFALMNFGSRFGIVGQAWACIPSAILLLGMALYLIVQARLLRPQQAVQVWAAMMTAVIVSGTLPLATMT